MLYYMRFIIYLLLISNFIISAYGFAPTPCENYNPIPASIVVNINSEEILHFDNAHKRVHPASLTKLMTLYLVFDKLQKKELFMEDKLTVSAKAANMKPAKLGLSTGEKITVKEAILGLIVRSANDAAVVLAEYLAPNENAFAFKMNAMARKLNMRDTYFRNASGWHHRLQKSTAIDMAKLAIAIKKDFPEYFHLFSTKEFMFRKFRVVGHNKVLRNLSGATGLKTGYTCKSGFNLITTVNRDGKELVGVVIGSEDASGRDTYMTDLLNTYYNNTNLAEDNDNHNIVRLSDKFIARKYHNINNK